VWAFQDELSVIYAPAAQTGVSICTLTELGGIALAKSKAAMLSSKAKRSVISGFTSILP